MASVTPFFIRLLKLSHCGDRATELNRSIMSIVNRIPARRTMPCQHENIWVLAA
ncbi:hypothetical protein RN629_00995 [Sphingomonadaceae bacterium jetA1]|uniref:hypothetical protein n=1 Tax=Facivitalis istanbulensis TaxID=3075838 RepID=UPI003479D3FE